MLLYQYVSEDVGIKILQANRAGFRRPEYFNDPFECALSAVQPGYNAQLIQAQMEQLGDRLDDSLGSLLLHSQHLIATKSVNLNCAVLCLTKNPLEPLMWSHYANLTGMVLGYEVSTDFFRGEHNACPVQFGEIIYSDQRPEPIFEGENTQSTNRWYYKPFEEQNLAAVQATLLTKPMRWKYEDEVRVVKRLNDETEDWIRTIETMEDGRDLVLYKLPPGCIKEVYRLFNLFVLHHYKIAPGLGRGPEISAFRELVVDRVGAALYAVTASQSSWEFDAEVLP